MATLGALFVAGVSVVFQVAFKFGRAWEDLAKLRDRLEEQEGQIDVIKEKIEQVAESRQALWDKDHVELIQNIWEERAQKEKQGTEAQEDQDNGEEEATYDTENV